MIFHPWPYAELRFAVAGRRIDVVDAMLQQQPQDIVGHILSDSPQRRTPEYDRCAMVTRAAKRLLPNHPHHSIISEK